MPYPPDTFFAVVSIEEASEPLLGSLNIKQPIVLPVAIPLRYWDCWYAEPYLSIAIATGELLTFIRLVSPQSPIAKISVIFV